MIKKLPWEDAKRRASMDQSVLSSVKEVRGPSCLHTVTIEPFVYAEDPSEDNLSTLSAKQAGPSPCASTPRTAEPDTNKFSRGFWGKPARKRCPGSYWVRIKSRLIISWFCKENEPFLLKTHTMDKKCTVTLAGGSPPAQGDIQPTTLTLVLQNLTNTQTFTVYSLVRCDVIIGKLWLTTTDFCDTSNYIQKKVFSNALGTSGNNW